MKGFEPIRIGTLGAVLAAAVAVGALLLSSASSSVATVGVEEAKSLFGLQVDALERYGLTSAQARREVEVQMAVKERHLPGKLRAALGDAFGGVWFEPAAAKLHVGVTSAASHATAEAVAEQAGLSGDVVATPVRSTWGQLRAAKEALGRRFAGLLAGGKVVTALQPDSNAVEVLMASTVPSSLRAELRSAASASPVAVTLVPSRESSFGTAPEARCRAFEYLKGFCNPTIASGVSAISSKGTPCTIGPAVIAHKPAKTTTETFLLTAGHCITKAGEEWPTSDKSEVSKYIGNVVVKLTGPSGGADVGVIKVENPEWINAGQTPVSPAIPIWQGTEVEPEPVTGWADALKNQTSCHSGSATGSQCGVITKVEIETTDEVKELVEVQFMTKASEEGDSGGPWFSTVKGGVLEEGVHYGRLVDKGVTTEFSLFEKVGWDLGALAAKGYEYDLLTTANQTRPQCPMPGMNCFNSEVENPKLTGAQPAGVNDVFAGDAGSVECENTSLTGAFVNGGIANLEAKLAPTYSGCKGFGVAVTVDPNGCEFVFHSDTKKVDLKCPAGKKMTFTNVGCEVTIGEQSKLTGVTSYTAEGTGASRALTIDFEIAGIAYEEHQKLLHTCKSETVLKTNGTYKGRATVTAETGAGLQKGLWVE